MRCRTLTLAAALTAGFVSTNANAADNLDKLSKFETTGVTEFTQIPQGGENAKAIKKTLERIKLPRGFKIGLYAVVPDARHMAVGPQGIVTIVGTRKTKVWSVTDRNKDRVADEVKDFAPSINFTIPNGPCFSKDGFLYIAERNRVLVFPAAEFFYESPDVAAFNVVKQGELIPPEDESYNHTARVCRIGPDGKLYITLGQPFNVPAPEKLDSFAKWGLGGIIRINNDGTGREVYTYGVRNSVGMDFAPNGDLWFTDNQVDGMGDKIPPGEINHQTKMGQNFGFPWYGGGSVRTKEYKDATPPADTVMPAVEEDAHAADLGMIFYTGKQFPRKYRGGIFSAQHGSWNRTDPVGARVMFTPVGEDGKAGQSVPFAEGWNNNGEYLGRPVDIAMLPDGSLLVSDDLVGALYRISYED
ncbi:MAG: PQQ-dependent sugar dehydrogenase [Rhodomicrobiaceae bacterium]